MYPGFLLRSYIEQDGSWYALTRAINEDGLFLRCTYTRKDLIHATR